jgi:hypothetical protein
MSDLFHPMTIESMRDCLQSVGYRAEIVTDAVAGITYLRSATSGLNFDIRMGNKLAGDQEGYADATLIAVFNVVGDMPLAPINAWNHSRRFGRLQIDTSIPNHKFLVLCMDIVVAGGVSRQNLNAQIAIWEGLLQQLTPWLREELAKIGSVNAEAHQNRVSEGKEEKASSDERSEADLPVPN